MTSLDMLAEPTWLPTRAQALRGLAEFVPRAGRSYAAQRNYDRGPTDRRNVSTLSPYIRHRVLTETEVLTSVLDRHSLAGAEKFVQEVFWRTYWKGWLQAHPATWSSYRTAVRELLAARRSNPDDGYAAALAGRTGIDAFDAWTHELVSTNYLHNHARMWFASIWIFTLRLPWELGADFFLRHLLDGDAAANTLSWRWVAGLHTRGKSYLASRENIRRYTGDRFRVTANLARSTIALSDCALPREPLAPGASMPQAALSEAAPPDARASATGASDASPPALLVVHDDDLHGDLRELPPGLGGVCAIRAASARSSQPVSSAVIAFSDAVGREAASRIAAAGSGADLGLIDATAAPEIAAALARLAASCGARRILVPFAPVGPVRTLLDTVAPHLTAQGLEYREFYRRYDVAAWPAATRGFFNLRSRIPALLSELGIGAG